MRYIVIKEIRYKGRWYMVYFKNIFLRWLFNPEPFLSKGRAIECAKKKTIGNWKEYKTTNKWEKFKKDDFRKEFDTMYSPLTTEGEKNEIIWDKDKTDIVLEELRI